jgi:hypothetical protein
MAYKSLSVEAVSAIGQETLEDRERIAVHYCVTVYALSWRVLKP